MKKYLLPSALILSLCAGLAFAQNITQGLQGAQDGRFIGVDANKNVYWPGHMLWSTTGSAAGGTPILTACVTGGSPTIAGTDWAGTITAGTTASTSCVVTFTQPYLAAPACLVSWNTGPLAAMSWTTSTTALTITQTSTASVGLTYMCTGAK